MLKCYNKGNHCWTILETEPSKEPLQIHSNILQRDVRKAVGFKSDLKVWFCSESIYVIRSFDFIAACFPAQRLTCNTSALTPSTASPWLHYGSQPNLLSALPILLSKFFLFIFTLLRFLFPLLYQG